MNRPFQMISSITTDQLRDLIHAAVNDMPEWDPSFGLTELQKAYAHAASPQIVLAILDQLDQAQNGMRHQSMMRIKKGLDRLQRLVDGYQQGAKAEADAGDEARAECRTLKAQLQVAESALRSAISTAQWQAFTNREMNAAREENLKLQKDVERLEAFCEYHQHSSKVWHRCFQVAEKDRDAATLRADYWKQRAKSAEGHLFASDSWAAFRAVHKISNFGEIPEAELAVWQHARISQVVHAVIVTINARRAIRRPPDNDATDFNETGNLTRQASTENQMGDTP